MAYDRDEVLARTDLGLLADELLGPHKGRGRSAMWPCPDRDHGPQTGRTPPVSVYESPRGTERWHCHGCGSGGTAVDLVMSVRGVGFGEAIEDLARSAGVGERERPWEPGRRWAPAATHPPVRPAPTPRPEVESYVAACEAHLWSPGGRPARQWLANRGLDEDVLRANRVGSDPGPRRLDRAEGLPRGGRAVVLPVLGEDGRAVYVQARYLHPRSHKYDNPSSTLAGPSPRVAEVRSPDGGGRGGVVVVAEGIPDGLTAAQAGYRSVAVLGAGVPDRRVAEDLARRYPTEQLVVAFDADHRGQAGAAALRSLMEERGTGHRVAVLEVPAAWGDLNGWLASAGPAFTGELAAAVDRAVGHFPGRQAVREPGQLEQDLERLEYQFVLGRDGPEASANVGRMRALVGRWETGAPVAPDTDGTSPGLDDAVEALCYRHLLPDDGRTAAARHEVIGQTLDRWSADLGIDRQPATAALDRATHRAPELDLTMEVGR